ncbi:MAG: cell division protein SepF [Clostridia bacterium]|nr:cell division protein SepF [Clostridia bacterium]
MGFMDWLMKGVGFESEEVYDNSVEKQKKYEERKAREEEKRRQKEEYKARKAQEKADKIANRYKLKQTKDVQQKEEVRANSYEENPDQYNTSRTYDAPVNNYGVNSTNVGGYGTKSVEFAYPTRFEEVEGIINFLKEGESVMLNLTNMNPSDSQRLLDCVSGAIFALNGNIRRVDNNIFLLTPEGFNIKVPERQ